jgi:hypothetical protein
MPLDTLAFAVVLIVAPVLVALPGGCCAETSQTGSLPAATAGRQTVALDGRALLSAGTLALEEGSDFRVLTSNGGWVSGPLQHVSVAELQSRLAHPNAAPPAAWAGAILLAPELPAGVSMADARKALETSGAAALLLVDDDTGAGAAGRSPLTAAPETRTPDVQTVGAVLAVSRAAMLRLMAIRPGDHAVLAVHLLAPGTPGIGAGTSQ